MLRPILRQALEIGVCIVGGIKEITWSCAAIISSNTFRSDTSKNTAFRLTGSLAASTSASLRILLAMVILVSPYYNSSLISGGVIRPDPKRSTL